MISMSNSRQYNWYGIGLLYAMIANEYKTLKIHWKTREKSIDFNSDWISIKKWKIQSCCL